MRVVKAGSAAMLLPKGEGHGPLGAARARMTRQNRWAAMIVPVRKASQRGSGRGTLGGMFGFSCQVGSTARPDVHYSAAPSRATCRGRETPACSANAVYRGDSRGA